MRLLRTVAEPWRNWSKGTESRDTKQMQEEKRRRSRGEDRKLANTRALTVQR